MERPTLFCLFFCCLSHWVTPFRVHMDGLEEELTSTLCMLQHSAEHLFRLERYLSLQSEAMGGFLDEVLHAAKAARMSASTDCAATLDREVTSAMMARVSQAFAAQQQRHDTLDEACRARVMTLHRERMKTLQTERKEVAPDLTDVREVERLRGELQRLLSEQAYLESLVADVDAKHTQLQSRRVMLEERTQTLREGTGSATRLSDAVIQQQLR